MEKYVLVMLDSFSHVPIWSVGTFDDEETAWTYYHENHDGSTMSVIPLNKVRQ